MNESEGMEELTAFSFFRRPIRNIEPIRAVTIVDMYRYVASTYAKSRTEILRSFQPMSPEAKKYKANNFDFCTFSGVFHRRNSSEFIAHSGLMCIDFDHVTDIPQFRERLLHHDYFDTELMFISPSGNGIKWIIKVDIRNWSHSRYYHSVVNCLSATGLSDIDMSGSDVCRSCYLPYDPNVFINPKYNNYVEENIFRSRMGECPF